MICSECCTIVPDGNFCPNCGAPLKQDGLNKQGFPEFDNESLPANTPEDEDRAFDEAKSVSDTPSVPHSSYSSDAPEYPTGGYGTNAGDQKAPAAYPAEGYTPNAGGSNAPHSPYSSSAPAYHAGGYGLNASGQKAQAAYPAGGYMPNAGGQKAPAAALVLVIVGLVLSLSGILAFPGIVCCIIGLALNSGYNRKGLVNERKTATLVLGLIGLIFGIFSTVAITFGMLVLVNASENGDIDLDSYLEEVLDETEDSSDIDEVPSIVHPEGHDADEDDADHRGDDSATSSNDDQADHQGAGVSGRISDEGAADEGAADDSDAAAADEAHRAFAGEWKLTDLYAEGEDRSEVLSLMESMDMKTSLVLEEDGTAEITIFEEESYSGTWGAQSPSSATLVFGGEAVPITLEDGVITLQATEDNIMYFERE